MKSLACEKRILFCTRFFSFSVTWFWNIITFSHWHMFSSDGLSVGKEKMRWEDPPVLGRVYFFLPSLSRPFPQPISSNLSLQVCLPVPARRDWCSCGWDTVSSARDCEAEMPAVMCFHTALQPKRMDRVARISGDQSSSRWQWCTILMEGSVFRKLACWMEIQMKYHRTVLLVMSYSYRFQLGAL